MMLPAAPIQQATSPVTQLLLLHLLNNTRYEELQNNLTVCDVEQFKLQNNVISDLEQKLQQSMVKEQELEQKLQKMTERNEALVSELVRNNLDLMKKVTKLQEENRNHQMQSIDSKSRLYSISHQAVVMKTTIEALEKQLFFITDEIEKSALSHPNSIAADNENTAHENNFSEDSIGNMKKQSWYYDVLDIGETDSLSADHQELITEDQYTTVNTEYTATDDQEFTTIAKQIDDNNSEIKELLVSMVNNKIKHYETQVDFKIGAGCKIVIKAIMENGSAIQFKLVDKDYEEKFEFTFNLESKTVHEHFDSRYINVWGKQVYKMQTEKESTITVQFVEGGIQMCIDDSTNCNNYIYPFSDHYFNKIKISDAELHDIRFHVPEENKPTYVKKSLNCSGDICDLRNVQKTGTVFSFTGKMPDNDEWVQSNFMVNKSRRPVHMSIRRNAWQSPGHTVFNHKENDYWDESQEERVFWFPFKRGQTYTFTFSIQKTGTTISLDGVYFHYFKHRIDVEPVNVFQYDWEMINASYSRIISEESQLSEE